MSVTSITVMCTVQSSTICLSASLPYYDISIHEPLDLTRHWSPLHKNAKTPIPQKPSSEEVYGSYYTETDMILPYLPRDLQLLVEPKVEPDRPHRDIHTCLKTATALHDVAQVDHGSKS